MAATTGKKRINRRRFLAVSGAGALVLAAGGVGLALQPGVAREPRRALQALSPRAFSVLAAVADRVCPGTGDLPTAWDLEVPEAVDAFLATSHPAVAQDLEQALLLVENGLPGLLFDLRPLAFTARTPEGQDATLAAMAQSRIALRRTVYKALVSLVSATYWGSAGAYRHIGYRPPDFSGAPGPAP